MNEPFMPSPKRQEGETMDRAQAEKLQKELLAVFRQYDIHVSLGLTAHGIRLLSQDARVEADTLR